MPPECILHLHPAFQHIIEHRQAFLTKACRGSFGGYAIQQVKKARSLDKKMNWEQNRVQRKGMLDFCYIYENGRTIPMLEFLKTHSMKPEKCGLTNVPHLKDGYNLYYSESGNYKGLEGKNHMLLLSSIPKSEKLIALMYYNKDAFTQHRKEYKSYQTWLKERNTQRYVDLKSHNQKIDGKNLMHCMRLIDEAREVATLNTINIKRPNAEYLISIRKGEVDLEDIIEQAEKGIAEIDQAFLDSNLPDECDPEFVHELLVEVRKMIEWSWL